MAFPAKIDRARVLAVALEHLARDGMQKLSLRSIAAELDVAPNALYRYFADRAQLEAALDAAITTQVYETLRAAAGRKAPESAIRAMAAAYLDFAHEHRFLYQAWVKPCSPIAESVSAHDALWSFVAEQVARVSDDKRAPEAATALWAFLHGFVELEAAGVFQESKHGKDSRKSFAWGLKAWLAAARLSGD
jgi:AcrR family transcriptional regulator